MSERMRTVLGALGLVDDGSGRHTAMAARKLLWATRVYLVLAGLGVVRLVSEPGTADKVLGGTVALMGAVLSVVAARYRRRHYAKPTSEPQA